MKFYRPIFCWESADLARARQRAQDRQQRWLTVFLVVVLLGLCWLLASVW